MGDEETPWGQQVELCIDAADMIIDNDEKNLQLFDENRARSGEATSYAASSL